MGININHTLNISDNELSTPADVLDLQDAIKKSQKCVEEKLIEVRNTKRLKNYERRDANLGVEHGNILNLLTAATPGNKIQQHQDTVKRQKNIISCGDSIVI